MKVNFCCVYCLKVFQFIKYQLQLMPFSLLQEKYTVAKILETGAFVKKMGSNDPNKYTVSSIQRLARQITGYAFPVIS